MNARPDDRALLRAGDPDLIIDGLSRLIRHPAGIVLIPAPDLAPPGAEPTRWLGPHGDEATVAQLADAVTEALTGDGELRAVRGALGAGWSVWVEPARSGPDEVVGALAVVREASGAWTQEEIAAVRVFTGMCAAAWAMASVEAGAAYQRHLDELVVRVAERLMSASSENLQETLDWSIRMLAEFLHADTAFLRRNDHPAGLSYLVAEYPARENVPDPDPLGAVPFDADPIFAATRDLKEPLVVRQSQSPDDYNDRIEQGSGIGEWSGAAVPLLQGDVTTGCLGFMHFMDREWTSPEINALRAVASLLVQLNFRIDAEERLHYHALHDDLTGLPNRRALLAEIDRRLDSSQAQTALLFLDLDRFKVMNDYLGHGAGDRVLVTIADRIRMSMRPSDFAARLGGDEFVILLGETNGDLGAIATANRLLDLVSQPIDFDGQHISHTGSVGIAVARRGETTALELLGRSDVALYAAKAEGRNRAVVFDHVLRAVVDERSDTELMLRDAIAADGLRLFYQPEFDLFTGEVVAMEALVRWDHPVRGLLTAGSFITIAEETGLIVDLGRWVMERACRQIAIWRSSYPRVPLTVRINMSPAQLSMPGIVEYVERCLQQAGLPGSAVCLEITEHAVIADVDRTVGILNEFRALGVSLAIDDFGTGFSSMTQLKHLPVNTLKIDTSFVSGIAGDPTDQAIVESIIRLGEAFGLDLVAEGVETVEDMRELMRLGCRRAQGFLLARPMPPEEVERILRRGGIDLTTLTSISSN